MMIMFGVILFFCAPALKVLKKTKLVWSKGGLATLQILTNSSFPLVEALWANVPTFP